jgi:hypothetical protein
MGLPVNKVIDDNNQDFKKIKTINIENCKLISIGEIDEVEIRSIQFSTNNNNTYISLALLWVIGNIFISLIYYFKKNKKLVSIKPIEYEPNTQTDFKTLMTN